ncbi:4-hydroxybenzoate octaprenyltransferase [Poriferisphaera corsica]|uniref:4-hydroxybenzoate octaprenyltransferase n=1 Tax=Poriferisphaera corsica TaxID=2528020 RepID=A0A517YW01_9BACT|nr:4-hydroxybenzoate octaprenyltransferase [Poriferisphaera corsica]QDU34407.1 4-hydroxybenzoate octaprenyltransferase [Poriferisphaera corsica]
MQDATTTSLPHTPPKITDQLAAAARDIKLSHTIFALPFALLATFLAANAHGEQAALSISQFTLIVLCMFFARSVAMLANRFLDADIDAQNDRTAKRAIPAGQLTRRFTLSLMVLCTFSFIALTAGFYLLNTNIYPLLLSPLILAYLIGYSYTKRFTFLCHVYLGTALALSPIAAAIAINPAYLKEPTTWLLSVMVASWVAGFDIIYALQDTEFDRKNKIYSMPSSLGTNKAMWISRSLHLNVILMLGLLFTLSTQLNQLFLIASFLTTALLVLEHVLVWKSSTNHINMAFFTLNGIISLLLGLAGVLDIFLR